LLTLTENAAEVVKTITAQTTQADEAGLRISQQGADASFAVSPVEAPLPGDQVLDQQGARVYLDEQAAAALDNEVLDAQVDPTGGVQFALGAQG
jgi:iron-sulfur cluster assembly protein